MKTTSRKSVSAPDKSEGNKKAIISRLRHRNDVQANGQNRHDLRTGRQPNYVDVKRRALNDVLIEPRSGAELKRICSDRRDQRGLQKRAKKDGKVATTGLIAFGVEAQIWFEHLDAATQNRAFLKTAEAICERCNTTLTGLVVHRDESAVHAHFQMPAYNMLGMPLTKSMTRADYSRLQDLVAEIILEFEPRIERGNRKWDRIAAGADYSDTVHHSVKRLHVDLPFEINEAELERDEVRAERDEMQVELDELRASIAALGAQREKVKQRILRLQQQEILSEQKAKNLRLYEGRLARHDADHQEAMAKLRVAEAEFEGQKAAVAGVRAEAEQRASETIARAMRQQDTLIEGVQMISEGKLWFDESRWHAPAVAPEMRNRLGPLLKLLLPLYTKVASLFESLKKDRDELTRERRALATEQARASAIVLELESVREQLNSEQAATLDRSREDLGPSY